jgi:hypothetical protein
MLNDKLPGSLPIIMLETVESQRRTGWLNWEMNSVLCTAFENIQIWIYKHRKVLPYLESQTIEDFGDKMALHRADVEHLRSVFMAVENGDIGMLKSLGIRVSLVWCISWNLNHLLQDSELGDVKFFLEKLVNTGFLDWDKFYKTDSSK